MRDNVLYEEIPIEEAKLHVKSGDISWWFVRWPHLPMVWFLTYGNDHNPGCISTDIFKVPNKYTSWVRQKELSFKRERWRDNGPLQITETSTYTIYTRGSVLPVHPFYAPLQSMFSPPKEGWISAWVKTTVLLALVSPKEPAYFESSLTRALVISTARSAFFIAKSSYSFEKTTSS